MAPLDVQQARNLYVVRGAPRWRGGATGRSELHAASGAARPPAFSRSGGAPWPAAYVPSVIEADIDFHLFVLRSLGQSADRRDRPAALAASAPRHGGGPERGATCALSVWDEHEGILRALEAGQRRARPKTLCRGHAEQMADILTGRSEGRDFPRGLSRRSHDDSEGGTRMKAHSSEQLGATSTRQRLPVLPAIISQPEETAILKASMPRRLRPAARGERARKDRRRGAHRLRRAHLPSGVRGAGPQSALRRASRATARSDKTYIHQFKINGKAAFDGDVWQWHQDYGTWKADDDMPEARGHESRGVRRRGERVQRPPLVHPAAATRRARSRPSTTSPPRPIRCG